MLAADSLGLSWKSAGSSTWPAMAVETRANPVLTATGRLTNNGV